MDAPAWLATHLHQGETVRWLEEPGDEAWRRILTSLAIWAWLTFYVGFSRPSWWQFLPIWPEHSVSPLLGAVAAGLFFLVDSLQTVLKHRYTAYAVTDRRLLRIGLDHPLSGLVPPRAESWPLERVRIVEKDRDKRRPRVRLELTRADGKRDSRFRLRPRDADALLAALKPAAPA